MTHTHTALSVLQWCCFCVCVCVRCLLAKRRLIKTISFDLIWTCVFTHILFAYVRWHKSKDLNWKTLVAWNITQVTHSGMREKIKFTFYCRYFVISRLQYNNEASFKPHKSPRTKKAPWCERERSRESQQNPDAGEAADDQPRQLLLVKISLTSSFICGIESHLQTSAVPIGFQYKFISCLSFKSIS